MMKKCNTLRVLSAFSILAAGFMMEANANPVSIAITAEVVTVDDPGAVLGGAIKIGNIITGTYVYESTAPDTNPDPTVGDYVYTTAPYGITLNANGYVFRTNPDNVQFGIEIVNDHGIPPSDNYLVGSNSNIFDISAPSSSPVQNIIRWQLDDPTLAALSSDALPIVAPTLTDWESVFGLTIESRTVDPFSSFFVRAHVTSAELICSKKIKKNSAKCK